ncbi:helix-turn-helix domain-containing protein [Streptomyces sp. NPDC059009]|uniref:AraC family transcriptional regulator n=1 Tax=Streptomyces sp. NPDC059009 TaxID=3346694 RepID=UPI0036C4E6B6
MDSQVFDSDDIELTEDFLCRAYARMRVSSSTPHHSRTHFRRASMPLVSVDELDLGFEMSYAVTPLGKFCLCLVHEGTIQDHTFQGVRDSFGPGDMVLLAPPDLPYAGRICRTRYNITLLDPALLDQVAAGADPSRGPVRLTGHRPHSPGAARQLTHTVLYVRDHILADPETAREPLLAAAAGRLLAASVLAAFPNTARVEPTAQDRNDAHPATLRRAIAYIDDHADQPLSVAEIAAAAHVTIRALQYAFRRHLDTTPLAYLRRVRLALAHQDLRTAHGSGATIERIAARWGFPHPGRFAAAYRRAYGAAPSVTLHNKTAPGPA